MRKFTLLAALLVLAVSCGTKDPLAMTKAEKALINESPEIMRILSVDNEDDLAVLRAKSIDMNAPDLNGAEYQKLANNLIKTLETTDGGVGLAAPQVGLNRRVVAVMRVDKEGEPIEVYPNIHITEMRGDMEPGSEGCLSVPDARGEVMRFQDITIVYTDIASGEQINEVVTGFAAVIFQHEVDHLEGIIFTDKLK